MSPLDAFVPGHVIQYLELARVHVDSKVQTVLKPVQKDGTEITACTGAIAWTVHRAITWMARALVRQVGMARTARKAAQLVTTECSVILGVSVVKMAQTLQHLAILWQDCAIVDLDFMVTSKIQIFF